MNTSTLTHSVSVQQEKKSDFALSRWLYFSKSNYQTDERSFSPVFPTDSAEWIMISICEDGACQIPLSPNGASTIIKSGDCLLAVCDTLPGKVLYPLGYYRGYSIFIHTDVLSEKNFSLLSESLSIHTWLLQLSSRPVVFESCSSINRAFLNLLPLCSEYDDTIARLRVTELLYLMEKHGLPLDNKNVYISSSQIMIAKETHQILHETENLEQDLQALSEKYRLAVGTLSNYFHAVYGEYIPTYMRSVRIHQAAEKIRSTKEPIYKIALAAGYSNASKFSAAFKRIYHINPAVYRLRNLPAKND